jgi:hypothetical protein
MTSLALVDSATVVPVVVSRIRVMTPPASCSLPQRPRWCYSSHSCVPGASTTFSRVTALRIRFGTRLRLLSHLESRFDGTRAARGWLPSGIDECRCAIAT